jgi:energy-coupling factor transporter transmembrane protein EcfT
MFELDIKILLSLGASLILALAYFPYIRDILQGKTKPHFYTWLIWVLTTGTAAAVLIEGGGAQGGWGLIIVALLMSVVALLSLKYGTRNVTRGDTVTLALALLAILVWWKLDNPLLSVYLVSLIDAIGYMPTFRKSWEEPESETVVYWFLSGIGALLALFSNAEYNALTVTYLATIGALDIAMMLMLVFRKKMLL